MNEELTKKMLNMTKSATLDDLHELTTVFISVVKDLKQGLEDSLSNKKSQVMGDMDGLLYEVKESELRLQNLVTAARQSSLADVKSLSKQLTDEMERIRYMIPNVPDMPDMDSYESRILGIVDARLNEVKSTIPAVSDIHLDTPMETVGKLNTLNDVLDPNVIRGWKDWERIIKSNTGKGGLPENFDVRIGVSKTEIKRLTDRIADLEASSSSSGTTVLTATGTVNGVNTSFTFTSAPVVITVDQSRVMQQTSSDGTVNWTGTTSVVLAIAPNFDIFGI